MITFLIGLLILFLGYIFYSRYVEKQFAPDDRLTPAVEINDGADFVPLSHPRNMLIQLLNIAGLGPILGALLGILFGPIAFILIPLGCIFMGGVHDYFSGMISVRNKGMQITDLIKKYLGNSYFKFFMVIVTIMLLLIAAVFVYTSGDIIAERFFGQKDFSLSNPIIIYIYSLVALYYILATIFPIDKIIGRFYPIFGGLLLLGTGLIFCGFFMNGIELQELNFSHLNNHPQNFPLIPLFFMTVSCGLLSGFHSTQSTIISRTIASEKQGRQVFYGMMCLESLICMIWAAGAMHVYSHNLVPQNIIGTANTINIIANTFVPAILTFVVTAAVVILPVTSGDTALRGLRMIIADAIKLPQNLVKNRLVIIIPLAIAMISIIIWAKINSNSFGMIWRYFTFFNQLIAVPTFLYATIFLYKNKKNYFITLIPALFYVFITISFISYQKIGLNLPLSSSKIIGLIFMIAVLIWIIFKLKKEGVQEN